MDSERLALIKEKIKNLGDSPGCYLWKDSSNTVIYVGKALKLNDRVKSYLNPNIQDIKTSSLQKEIFDLDWIVVNTEEEALILESNLIKKYYPRYNVRLKDDKKYPFICVSTDESFPMIYLTRRVRGDSKRYFGPFTDVKSTRTLLNLIHRIFPIRKTPLNLPLPKPQKPCLNFHMKRCLGPCQGNVSVEEYSHIINPIIQFLEGKRDSLVSELYKRMQEYSDKLMFERAAIYRDMIENINSFQKKQTIVNPGGGDEDYIALARRDNEGQIVIFEVREGKLEGKKSFALSGLDFSNEQDAILSFMNLYYLNATFIPSYIVVPLKLKKDSNILVQAILEKTNTKMKIINPPGGNRKSLLKLASKNAEVNLTERILATKLKDETIALKQLKEYLNLREIPRVIECYDISHIQGHEPVGSGVMFVDGKPYKSGYRHYVIRGYEGINDPGMMHEVIARRFQKLLNENLDLPDLVVIDGGYTQLSRASEALLALELRDIQIIGLAKKREEIYFPGEKEPYSFDMNSPFMRLLRRIRDEAHRFGITHHRLRRNKSSARTLISGLDNIGKGRASALLKFFSGRKKSHRCNKRRINSDPGYR